MPLFRSLLVPHDLSECSRKAVRVASELATSLDARCVLLFVQDRSPGDSTWVDPDRARQEIAEIESDEAALWAEVESILGSRPPNMRVHLTAGEPAAEVVRVADEDGHDLIVMGTHGRSGFTERLLGSTTERVLRKANCAVLAVKPDGWPFLKD